MIANVPRSFRVALVLAALLLAREAQAFITIAHRGGRIEYPENTILAFLDSLSRGVDWVECDLRSSGDGVLICFHDDDLTRVTGGVYTGLVDSYSFAELRAMNVCDLHCDVYTPDNPATIPTFQEVLLAVRGMGPLLLDIKLTADLSQARAELDASGGVESDVIGWIRYDQIGTQFRALFPNSMAFAGIGPLDRLDEREIGRLADLGYAGLLASQGHFTSGGGSVLVDQIRSYGLLVAIWEANPGNFEELMSFGPDGLVNQNAQALVEFEASYPCIDDQDNDGDGAIDFREDAGCRIPLDLSEEFDCSDGLDNDGDRRVDERDLDCDGPDDPAEQYACEDLIDNDGDGWIDWPEDPGCRWPTERSETPRIPALGAAGGFVAFLALAGMGAAARRRGRAAG